MFASEGLRTLVLGLRILSKKVYSNWFINFELASNSLKYQERKLHEVVAEIEIKLYIVGSIMFEDKLQDGVPKTIYNIGKAGLKLWVLTSDKRKTVIEIGYATKVLTMIMRITQIVGGIIEIRIYYSKDIPLADEIRVSFSITVIYSWAFNTFTSRPS